MIKLSRTAWARLIAVRCQSMDREMSSVANNMLSPGSAEGVRKGVASSAKGIAAAEDVP